MRQLVLKLSYLEALKINSVSLTGKIHSIINEIISFHVNTNKKFNEKYYSFWKSMMDEFGIIIIDGALETPLMKCFEVKRNII